MATIGAGISLRGLENELWHFPFMLASGITKDDEGKLVSLDTSAANTVKLAADAEVPIGKLKVVEDRSVEGVLVGTVALKGAMSVPTDGAISAVGDSITGSATAGVAKTAVAANEWTVVVELDNAASTAVVIFK